MSAAKPLPTGAELSILRVLWKHGALSVRDVHAFLASGTGYTTTLKILQTMRAKGLVSRDDGARQHVYSPLVGERQTLGALTAQFADNVFGGSGGALALRALGDRSASAAELADLKRLIASIETPKRK